MEIFNDWLASNSTDRPSLGFLIIKVWRRKENLRNSLRIPGSLVVSTWHFHIHSIPWEN